MKTDEEFIKGVFERKNKRMKKRKRKITAVISVLSAAVVTVTLTAVLNGTNSVSPFVSYDTVSEASVQNEKSDAGQEVAREIVTEETADGDFFDGANEEVYNGMLESEKSAESAYQFGTGYYMKLTSACCNVPVKYSKEAIKPGDAKEYLSAHGRDILSGIAFENPGKYRLYTKGYSFVSVKENGSNVLGRNSISFPVMKDEKIVAVVQLFLYDGEINDNVSFGGETFDYLTEIFNSNPDDELVFAVLDAVPEVIINSKNELYFIPAAAEYESGADYYNSLKTPCNTFSKSDLDNPDNYITINM